MKNNYDFSKGRRGAVIPAPRTKVSITLRLDRDILDWFRHQVEQAAGGNYETLINDALRAWMQHQDEPLDEATLRRVLREELADTSKSK